MAIEVDKVSGPVLVGVWVREGPRTHTGVVDIVVFIFNTHLQVVVE